ncbi:hypothetical protein E3U36_07940 [Arsenophonus endosymbiont of Aphis craccivora]|nr:hypothetical protein E3U36_07940 [Arsenophonus endosymbiont of Aphis craccivora]
MVLLMARKIQQRGFHHSKIIMFDTGYHYPEMVRCIPQMGLDEFKQKLCRFDGIFPDIREEDIDRYHSLYNHHRLLLTGITDVPHFSGRAWLIQVRDKEYTFDIERAAVAWRQVIPQLVALPTSGNHWSLMDPLTCKKWRRWWKISWLNIARRWLRKYAYEHRKTAKFTCCFSPLASSGA